MTLRNDADLIIKESIHRVLPDEAVAHALKNKKFGTGKLIVNTIRKIFYYTLFTKYF